ncbi:Lariat debranching enzyme like [Actinidia chinensis var. chinensis]|uniref:Lariat debranching enzyme like n=1 Tax=Actinidia chinensis var. chinensis TaxID=1590841 RepID=A0A2R6R8R7_ACTCC|nr:Lariat debranching enzyme like [Actinidia chinensis var. chinensis]
MPRPSPRPRPPTENGRKLEPCQTLISSASGSPGPPNNLKVDNKERKVNGVIEPQSKSSSSKKSSAITQADQIAQASMKPPHPDSKYLSQVFSVPKMEKWSDFGDQEWLFSSKDCSSEKPNMGSINVTEMPMVWDEAMQIESDDVCALPYVIPY